jgi:hypothetical protein
MAPPTPTLAARWAAVRRPAAYGAVMFASSALHNVFVTYYVALFAALPSLTPAWFYAGQLAFMVWNAVNDPLFGWLSDTMALPAWWAGGGGGAQSASPLARRAGAIRWGGLGWAAAFLLVWWPWPGEGGGGEPPADDATYYDGAGGLSSFSPAALATGAHFTLSLLLYDSALTYVEVNHGALLADMSHSGGERAGANAWAAGMAAAGSVTSLAAYATWDARGGHHQGAFRAFVTALAAACAVVFVWASHVLSQPPPLPPVGEAADGSSSSEDGGSKSRADYSVANGGGAPANGSAPATADGDVIDMPPATPSSSDGGAAMTRHRITRPHDDSGGSEHNAAAPQLDGDVAAGAASPLVGGAGTGGTGGLRGYLVLLRQLAGSPSFRAFTAVSVLQTFDCTFEKNFFVPFMDLLALGGGGGGAAAAAVGSGGEDDPSPSGGLAASPATATHLRGGVIALSFLLPHVLTIALTPLVRSRGVGAVLSLVLRSRLALLAAVWAASRWLGGGNSSGGAAAGPLDADTSSGAGGGSPLLAGDAFAPLSSSAGGVLAFMLANRVASESVCRLFPLVLSDLVDEDAARHRRVRVAVDGATARHGTGREGPLLAYPAPARLMSPSQTPPPSPAPSTPPHARARSPPRCRRPSWAARRSLASWRSPRRQWPCTRCCRSCGQPRQRQQARQRRLVGPPLQRQLPRLPPPLPAPPRPGGRPLCSAGWRRLAAPPVHCCRRRRRRRWRRSRGGCCSRCPPPRWRCSWARGGGALATAQVTAPAAPGGGTAGRPHSSSPARATATPADPAGVLTRPA